MNEETIGSNFDDFLTEEGLLEEAEVVAVKRALAFQIKINCGQSQRAG